MGSMGNLISQATSQAQLTNLLESDKFGIYAASTYLACDGVADDYADLYALINTTINGADAEIWFKDGTCLIGSNITIPSNIKLKFLNGGMLKPASGVTITGSNSKIHAGLTQIFDLSDGGLLAGTWDVEETFLEWFGAVGNGSTDDTNYFKYAVDFCNLQTKATLHLIPNKTYKITAPTNATKYPTRAGFIFTSNYVKVYSENATISIADGTSVDVFWFLGDASAYTSETAYSGATHYSSLNEYAEVNGIIFDFGTTGSGTDTSVRFRNIETAKILNCKVLNSSENGINFEQCKNIYCNNNEIKDFQSYGIFAWMCYNGNISSNVIDGGTTGDRAIVVKHCYNGKKYSNLKIESNDILNVSGYGISSGDTKEAVAGIYETNHEKVWGVSVYQNRFYIPSGGFSTAGINLGQFTNSWKVSENAFIATDSLAGGNVMAITGNYADLTAGNAGDRKANHVISNNNFFDINATGNGILSVKATCQIIGNEFINCKGTLLNAPKTTYADGDYSSPHFFFENNVAKDCTIADDSRDSFIYVNDVPYVIAKNNKFLNTVVDATSNYFFNIANTATTFFVIDGLIVDGLTGDKTVIAIAITSTATHLVFKNSFITNLTSTCTSLQIIRTDSTIVETENNIVDFTGNTSTNRNLIFATANVDEIRDNGGNLITNSTAIISSANDLAAQGVNTSQRLYYKSAAPGAGTYRRGDIVLYTAPSAAGKIGSVCVTAGTPGTWKEFGVIDA